MIGIVQRIRIRTDKQLGRYLHRITIYECSSTILSQITSSIVSAMGSGHAGNEGNLLYDPYYVPGGSSNRSACSCEGYDDFSISNYIHFYKLFPPNVSNTAGQSANYNGEKSIAENCQQIEAAKGAKQPNENVTEKVE
eukprot:Gb_21849 [translate_table: standard]